MPKLTMREIRRNPAVLTEPSDLRPGLDVALCHFVPPIGKGTRCAQALMGLMAEPKTLSRLERMKCGYRFTPAWGIIADSVATVKWVNATNQAYEHPYASFTVTQSLNDSSLAERWNNPATSVAEVKARIHEVPLVNMFNSQGDTVHAFEHIAGFEDLGLAPDQHGLGRFILKLGE